MTGRSSPAHGGSAANGGSPQTVAVESGGENQKPADNSDVLCVTVAAWRAIGEVGEVQSGG